MVYRILTKIIRNNKFQLILRIILGLFFTISGLFKVIDPASFGKIILSYDMVPQNWIIPLALIIPYAELSIGLALLLNLFPKFVSAAAILLMIAFTIISMYKYNQGDISDCGCFGKLIERKNDWKLFVENIIVMCFLSIIMFTNWKGKKR